MTLDGISWIWIVHFEVSQVLINSRCFSTTFVARGSWQVSATAGVNAMVPGSKAGFEMWIDGKEKIWFPCAFNDFSHCKFPDCSLLHWQVDAIIGFCNIRHFMEATEVRNSLNFSIFRYFWTAFTETTCRRLHWWRIPACVNCVTKVLKEKVMLFAKALPCRIKHVLSHLLRPIFVLIFATHQNIDIRWTKSARLCMVVMFWDQQCYCKMLNEWYYEWYPILSDIVRYPWYPWWSMKIQQISVSFENLATDDLINSLRCGWFPWSTESKHRRCLPGDLATLRWVGLASFYRSLSRGKNLWCQVARRKSKPSWQTWLSCHMLGTWGING